MSDKTADKYPPSYPYLVNPPAIDMPDISKANMSDYWGPEYQNKIRKVLEANSELFREELGCFNNGVHMPISFCPDVDISDLRQSLYNLSRKDQKGVDTVLDPLREAGVVEKVPLGTLLPAASSMFVVWKNNKPCLVIDFCQVNTKMFLDTYLLPKQDIILSVLGRLSIFSSVDMVRGFFQQLIKLEDR